MWLHVRVFSFIKCNKLVNLRFKISKLTSVFINIVNLKTFYTLRNFKL
jgi:hypothetical protein